MTADNLYRLSVTWIDRVIQRAHQIKVAKEKNLQENTVLKLQRNITEELMLL